jgi:hypothetical protein
MAKKSKTKRTRWECPNGDHPGVLGPTRPRKDSIVRYCLPCSEASGKLVERIAPALERKRAAKADARKAKAKQKREREQAKAREWPNVLELMFPKLKKLSCWSKQVKHARLELRYSKTRSFSPGHARYYSGRITMTAGSDVGGAIETLMHELAHIAHYERYGNDDRKHHSTRFYGVLFEASEQLLGEKYMGGIRAAARERRGRVTKGGLDAELSRRYNDAIRDGVFEEYGVSETTVKAAKPKKRGPKLPPGRVRFAISDRLACAMSLDDRDSEWHEAYPYLSAAYQNGTYRRTGKGGTTIVEGPPQLLTETLKELSYAPCGEPGEQQAVERLERKLYEMEYRHKRIGTIMHQLFITLGRIA